MTKNIVTLDETTFGDAISNDQPILVDFWAEWCAPCKMIAPTLEEVASEHGDRITIGKLNVDENPGTAMAYDVMSIPTLIVFEDGVEKKRIVGARPRNALIQELSEFIG